MEVKYDKGFKLIFKYVNRVFPKVDKQLDRWVDVCIKAENKMICNQALSSINLKRFHAQGGSVFALYPNVDLTKAIKFIVSFQTISDYLDNLCDRAGVQSEKSFRQLHLSMMDAVDFEQEIKDYYCFYPYKGDNNYLKNLVEECRDQIKDLPSYYLVIDSIKKYVKLYSEMQTYKHLELETREILLSSWAEKHMEMYPDISCWEFSAASGSTLGIFALFVAASDPELNFQEVLAIDSVYFPWITGLHILLDYYIDSYEDMQMGDLNFTGYYKNLKHCEERLVFFIENCLDYCSDLSYPDFHITVVKGLLALYLSDPKASVGLNKIASSNLIKKGGSDTKMYYNMCKLLRSIGVI